MMNIKIPVDHTEIIRAGADEIVKRYRKAAAVKKYWPKPDEDLHNYFSTMESFKRIIFFGKGQNTIAKKNVVTCPLCFGKGERSVAIDVEKSMKVIATKGFALIVRYKLCLCCGCVWETNENLHNIAKERNPQRDLFEEKAA
jgi:hypothetical protein